MTENIIGDDNRFKPISDFEELKNAQLARLNESIKHASNARRYKSLKGLKLNDIESLGLLPFVYPKDIEGGFEELLAIKPEEIARIVSLQTSGTTGSPKRVAFSMEDIEGTLAFFRHMYQNEGLAGEKKRVLTLLPGRAEYGAQSLLKISAEQSGSEALCFYSPDPKALASVALEFDPSYIIAMPVQALQMLEAANGGLKTEHIALTADYIAPSLRHRVERASQAQVFSHYGLTEACFVAAIECHYGRLHPPDLDIYFETVDPDSGSPLKDGEFGALAMTTLGKRAMPFIRYRSGDFASINRSVCQCGRVTALSQPVRGDSFFMPNGLPSMASLDEAFFANESILDWCFASYEKPAVIIWLKGGLGKGEAAALARSLLGNGTVIEFKNAFSSPSPGMLGKRGGIKRQ